MSRPLVTLSPTGQPMWTATTPLGRMLQRWRWEHRRMSQTKLADLLDVDHATVSRIESGDRNLGLASIPHWSRVLDIQEVDLVLLTYGIEPEAYEASIRADERSRIVAMIADGRDAA